MAHNLIPSNTTIKAIKPGDARRRLSDGAGMSTARSSNKVEHEGIDVVGGGQEPRDARALAGVALLGQFQQSSVSLRSSLTRLKGPGLAGGDLSIDSVMAHVKHLGQLRDDWPDGRAGRCLPVR